MGAMRAVARGASSPRSGLAHPAQSSRSTDVLGWRVGVRCSRTNEMVCTFAYRLRRRRLASLASRQQQATPNQPRLCSELRRAWHHARMAAPMSATLNGARQSGHPAPGERRAQSSMHSRQNWCLQGSRALMGDVPRHTGHSSSSSTGAAPGCGADGSSAPPPAPRPAAPPPPPAPAPPAPAPPAPPPPAPAST